MIKSTKEAEFPLKQEGLLSNEKAKASSSSNSSQWLKLKDPRIVRVSRAFGGKDRHSKVCTVRGLRDRRVRLSVPTAIHLYDLQDRLGLSQPSKVVDWLLNAAKEEIDELPPLPIPAGNFTLGFPSLVTSTSLEGSGQNSTIWKQKSKEAISSDKETSINRSDNDDGDDDDDKRGSNNNDCTHHPNSACAHVLQNHLLSRANNNHASLLGLLNTMPCGNYQQWEVNSSIDAGQLGNHAFVNQNVVPFPSTLALSSGNSSTTSQILVYPPSGAITQPYFPNSHHHVATVEMNPRQINHYHQMMSSSSQNLLMSTNSLQHHLMSHSGKVPFSLDSPKQLLHSPNSSESYSHNKEQDFASSK